MKCQTRDFAKGFQTEYVLGKWTKAEEETLIPKITEAIEIIKSFIVARPTQNSPQ